MFKLKIPDQKLFEHLNAQIKKRIHYIYAKDLVMCCAANIVCNYQEKKNFVVFVLNYFIQKNITRMLNMKEKVNFLVLINQVSGWKFDDISYKTQLNLLMEAVIKGVIEGQNKFIKSGGKLSAKATEEKEKSTDTLTIQDPAGPVRVLYMDKFYRVMIQSQKFQANILELIKTIINKKCVVSLSDLLYFTAYTIQYSRAKNEDQTNLLSSLLVKLNEEFTKASGENLDVLRYICEEILKNFQNNYGVLTDDLKKASLLILRKFIHSTVHYTHKLKQDSLIKIAELFMEYPEVPVSKNKTFSCIEFFISSINKNIMTPLFIRNPTINENNEVDTEVLLVNEKMKKNILNTLYILTMAMCKEYPVVQEIAIWEAYEYLFKEQFNPEDLTTEDLDILNEIFAMFENSVSGNPFKGFMSDKFVKHALQKRLETIQENSLKRRKNLRTEVEALILETTNNKAQVSENTIIAERALVDVLAVLDNKKYAVYFYSKSEDGEEKPLDILNKKGGYEHLSPLREKLLNYKGYKTLFLNIPKWINLTAYDRRKMIENFLQ